MKRRSGLTLIELIVASTVMAVLAAFGMVAIPSLLAINDTIVNLPPAQSNAIDVVDAIAGSVRRAPLCTSGGTVNAAVQAGTATSITLCTSGTAYVIYSIDGSGNFIQKTGTLPTGGSTTTTTLEPATVALTFQYCLSNTGTPCVVDTFGTTDPLTDTTTNNSQVTWVSGGSLPLTAGQLPDVIAVKITATVTRGGNSASFATTVRLRNSPA